MDTKIANEQMQSPNYSVIFTIVTEMARCVNQNIGKVHIAPLEPKLIGDGTIDWARLIAINSQS